MYLDSNNWAKASAEHKDNKIQGLNSVVTNNGYYDWCSTDIPSSIKSMWIGLVEENLIIILNILMMEKIGNK